MRTKGEGEREGVLSSVHTFKKTSNKRMQQPPFERFHLLLEEMCWVHPSGRDYLEQEITTRVREKLGSISLSDVVITYIDDHADGLCFISFHPPNSNVQPQKVDVSDFQTYERENLLVKACIVGDAAAIVALALHQVYFLNCRLFRNIQICLFLCHVLERPRIAKLLETMIPYTGWDSKTYTREHIWRVWRLGMVGHDAFNNWSMLIRWIKEDEDELACAHKCLLEHTTLPLDVIKMIVNQM
jgi:hypothetical protein